jgi:hypothetical protein
MKRLDEETLNAYADGALDADARAEVEAQLAIDAEARGFVEKLRRVNALAVEAYAAPMHEAPPQALVDTIVGGRARVAATDRDAPVPTQKSRAWSIRDYALPLAAVLVLAAGISGGVFLERYAGQAPEQLALGAVPPGGSLHSLLERHPSGGALDVGSPWSAGQRLSVVASFQDRHARFCREIELLPAGTDPQAIAAAVACRDPGGRWTIEGGARLAIAQQTTEGQFAPSGVPEKDALEGLLTMLGAQRAMSPAEEKAAIERGWKN